MMTDKDKLDAIVALLGDTRMKHDQYMEKYKRYAQDAADQRQPAVYDRHRKAQQMHHYAEIVVNSLLVEVMEIVESE
jgi:hypothetical protein